jgi:predicted ATPase/class 3 adenylate cyclase
VGSDVQQALRFGALELRPAERQVLWAGQAVAIDGRGFDLLSLLIERRAQAVPRAELLQTLWPAGADEDDALALQVSALRRVLGLRAIATVDGSAYRVTLATDAQQDETSPAQALGAARPAAFTYLFTDIEGSTRLWEQQPEAMRPVLAAHDTLCRRLVARHDGVVVKMTGDGVHAAFTEARQALTTAVELQRALGELQIADGQRLRVRMGLNAGIDQYRDGDFFGPAVNRAARVMSAAHGGQILLSHAVVVQMNDVLPADTRVRELGLVRLRDLASSERIFQVEHPDLPREFPALRSLEATPNNLPQQLNSFVDRVDEVRQGRALLARHRLVTLLGMGGLGKSRLSIQLAAEVQDEFPDGVWLVELAPIADARLIAQAVAAVLKVREDGASDLESALAQFMAERRLLLVLDNCEHLLDGCAQFAKTMLQAAPQLRILASSRSYLRVAGEVALPVPPLPVPPTDHTATPERLAREYAVQLFVERAVAGRPEFRCTDDNAHAVAEICARLDGIPLALEIAAARTRSLPVETIAARLQDRFKLLVTPDRTVLPRQRTLRALIDWSYQLLDEPKRLLFQRLAVFAGSFTLEDAEAVCGSVPLAPEDVLDLLAALVEESLVVLQADGQTYAMLETVRAYALELFDATSEAESIRDAHLMHYLDLAEQARRDLFSPREADWMLRLDRTRPNLLAAHEWCDHARDGGPLGLRMAIALKWYWSKRGLLALALRTATQAVGREGARPPTRERARVLSDVGQLRNFRGEHAQALPVLDESLSIGRALGDQQRIAAVLQPLCSALAAMGHYGDALTHGKEAIHLAVALGDEASRVSALNLLAQCCFRPQSLWEEAEAHFSDALDGARRLGNLEFETVILLNLAMVGMSAGKPDDAARWLFEALRLSAQRADAMAGPVAVGVAAAWCAQEERWSEAARLFGAADTTMQAAGLRFDPADLAFLEPYRQRTRAALPPGVFDLHATDGTRMSLEQSLTESRTQLETVLTGRS